MGDGVEKFIPRGIRNNNPGNIKKNDVEWEGLSAIQTDKTFFQFNDPIYGIRALTKILRTYRNSYNIKNIWGIINRYAPPSENDTESYKNFVKEKTGLNMLEEIEFTVEGYLPVVKAIILMENGEQPYDDEIILQGMHLAWQN
jgi:hypothetical protein|tara:strand:- start:3142 stop:3570 length:429 start_codon:yes stop_codon:yes gene_type:complete